MGLEDNVRKLRQVRINVHGFEIPDQFNGIAKDKIELVLSKIGVASQDTVDVVFALLDDQNKSWFRKATRYSFSEGASTAHLGCHVGILQRGKNKLDREGRDYWIKPLRDLGIIEAVTFISEEGIFVLGHPISKSSNSAYRLNSEFKQILGSDGEDLDLILKEWFREDKIRERAELRARIEATVKLKVETKHEDLIKSCVEYYVPAFLKDFEILFIDQSDGDRVTEEEIELLAKAGLKIALDDPMPDVLLWNERLDTFWVIEAVTSPSFRVIISLLI